MADDPGAGWRCSKVVMSAIISCAELPCWVDQNRTEASTPIGLGGLVISSNQRPIPLWPVKRGWIVCYSPSSAWTTTRACPNSSVRKDGLTVSPTRC